MTISPGHGHALSWYQLGATTIFASRADQRFAYCLYVPQSYREDEDRRYPVAVLVHSTDRDAQYVRDEFIDFAEESQCILFAPLFPAGIDEPGELHNYKYLDFHGLRFDLLLLRMLDEIAELYRVDVDKFLLTGFSGGGHFTHRFLIAHPGRLLGASIAAPGVVTLLDETRPWPAGVADLDAVLGVRFDPAAIARVPVQLVIGDADLETWEIAIPPDEPDHIPGVNDVDTNRQVRIRALGESLRAVGATVELDSVPGVDHDGRPLAPPTKRFFARVLSSSGTPVT